MIHHTRMQEATWEQVHRQEAGIIRLRQRSRECFRRLKAAASHPPQQACSPVQDQELHTQPAAALAADSSADVQPMRVTQEVQREQQVQLGVSALESPPSQPRSASPVKGTHLTDACHDCAHAPCSSWTESANAKAPCLTTKAF